MASEEMVYARVKRSGETSGMFTVAEQVVLRLRADGTFTLLDASYHDDTWGLREESSDTWSGVYVEEDGAVVCRATSKRTYSRSRDRDWGKDDVEKNVRQVSDVFTFAREDARGLTCPLERFEGLTLSQDQEPHPGAF